MLILCSYNIPSKIYTMLPHLTIILLLYNKLPKFNVLKHKCVTSQFCTLEVRHGSLWAKNQGVSHVAFPFGGSKEDYVPMSFSASQGCLHSLAHSCLLSSPPSIFKTSNGTGGRVLLTPLLPSFLVHF